MLERASRRVWIVAFMASILWATFAYAVPPATSPGLQNVEAGDSAAVETGEDQQEPDTEQNPATLIAVPTDLIPALRNYLESAQRSAGNPEDETRRAEKDLEAQQEMARWADWMALAGIVSAGAATLAVVLVWLTLRESKKMLVEAEKATAEARQSSRAALISAIAARQTARAMMNADRARVMFRKMVVADPQEGTGAVKVSYILRNVGTSVARMVDVTLYGFIGTAEDFPETPIYEGGEIDTMRDLIAPNDELGIKSLGGVFLATPEDFARVKTKEYILVVYGRLRYVDVYKRKQTYRFAHTFPLKPKNTVYFTYRPESLYWEET